MLTPMASKYIWIWKKLIFFICPMPVLLSAPYNAWRCAVLLLSTLLPAVFSAVPSYEYDALHSFYNATGGENWRYSSQSGGIEWDFSTSGGDPCADGWIGLVCNGTAADCSIASCSVLELNLGSTNLKGTIPSSLADLNNIYYLYLGTNSLEFTIPSAIGQMTDLLYLNLRENSLVGSIPRSLASLTQLQFLSLRINCLTGSIPSSFASLTDLGSLMLDYNSLDGQLPDIFGDINEIIILTLARNRFEGSIPSSIGSLNKMETFLFKVNQLSGTIPSTLGSCSNLKILSGGMNRLSGSIPSSIGSLANLVSFDFSYNFLNGEFPSSVGEMKMVTSFTLEYNSLSGSIPTSIGGMSSLTNVIFSFNFLTGTIPSEIFSPAMNIINFEYNFLHGSLSIPSTCQNLKSLGLADNAITGSIPSSLLMISRLRTVHLSNNFFSSSIPNNIGTHSNLRDFAIDSNYITGSLPETTFYSNMQIFFAQQNYLTGKIPEPVQDVGLGYLYMYSNYLTGTLPDFDHFAALNYLLLFSNQLSGTIPISLAAKPYLSQVQLQDNELSGNPDLPFLSHILETLDISRNKFTGSVPVQLFHSRKLENLVMSLNCFGGEISADICSNNSAIRMLSLDGLRAGDKCDLTRLIYAQTMEGTIPECIFAFSQLETLNMAGNGFYGTIVSALPTDSLLKDLTLSHNRLTGTLSVAMQHWPFRKLDLSYNRLTGELQHITNYGAVYDDNITEIILKENRFSGDLLSDFRDVGTIDVLSGNMFTCLHLPRNDLSYDFYSCGSDNLNNAIITWGVFFPFVILAVLGVNVFHTYRGYRIRNSVKENVFTGYLEFLRKQYKDIMKYASITTPSKNLQSIMPQLSMFVMLLYELRRIALIVSFYSVVVIGTIVLLLKTYGIKYWERVYPTYIDQYSWVWSVAYLGGYDTAVVFAAIWGTAMCYYVYVVTTHAWDRHKVHETAGAGRMSVITPKRSLAISISSTKSVFSRSKSHAYAAVLGIVLLDIFVVMLINGQYVRIMLTDITRAQIFFVQVALTAFNVSWNKIICVSITNFTQEAAMFLVSFQHFVLLLVLLVNNVLAPVVSSILVDNSCLRPFILKEEEVDSEYEYFGCSAFSATELGSISCSLSSLQYFTIRYSPSFMYNYECTSSVISNYIPILLYVYLVQSIMFPILFAMLSSLKYDTIPKRISEQLPGFLWPKDTNKVGRKLIPSAELLASTRSHLAVLLTFGMVSPPLAIAVSCAMVINIYRWQIYIGRYMVQSEFRASMFDVRPLSQAKIEPIHNILNRKSLDGRTSSNTEMIKMSSSSTEIKSFQDLHNVGSPEESSWHRNESRDISSLSLSGCHHSSISDYTLTSCFNIENSLTEMSAGYRACAILILIVCNVFFSCILLDMSGDEVGFHASIWVFVTMFAITTLLSVYVVGVKYYHISRPADEEAIDDI